MIKDIFIIKIFKYKLYPLHVKFNSISEGSTSTYVETEQIFFVMASHLNEPLEGGSTL